MSPGPSIAMRRLAGLLSALALLTSAAAVHARKSDAEQPVHIRAASVEVNEKTGLAVYRGQVVMTQGSLRLEGDRVDITLREGRLERAVATGKPARLRSLGDGGEELEARAARVDYQAGPRVVDLEGAVWLRRGADEFTGGKARYELDTRRFTARGANDGQVTAIIHPPAPETPK